MLKISQESGAMLSPGKTKVLRAGRILGAQQSPKIVTSPMAGMGNAYPTLPSSLRTYTDKVERQKPDSHRET